MNRTAFKIPVAALLLFLGACAGCKTEKAVQGIPNFAQVEPGVWRGGQPTKEGWDYLKSLGVINVVKLNEEKEASDSYARSIGIRVINEWAISFPQQMGLEKLPPGYVWIFDQLRDYTNRSFRKGLFIHCEHGQDRTGLFVALYRKNVEGWSKEKAEQEMLDHGFHKVLHGLWEFWENSK